MLINGAEFGLLFVITELLELFIQPLVTLAAVTSFLQRTLAIGHDLPPRLYSGRILGLII